MYIPPDIWQQIVDYLQPQSYVYVVRHFTGPIPRPDQRYFSSGEVAIIALCWDREQVNTVSRNRGIPIGYSQSDSRGCWDEYDNWYLNCLDYIKVPVGEEFNVNGIFQEPFRDLENSSDDETNQDTET